jgi:RIO-like serine/threonine protein kinase
LTAGQACSSPFANNDAEAATLLEMGQMDKIDMKILEAINTISTKSFVSSVKVNEILSLNATELGDRLKRLKKSGHVDITTSEYPSSLTLPNSISKVYLTELGRRCLKQKR